MKRYKFRTKLSAVLRERSELIQAWFEEKRGELSMPIYGSVDIRDSGYKVGVVDANFFPAGFNNIEEEEIESVVILFKQHIESNHSDVKHVHLYPESHTRNLAYVENLSMIKKILIKAGYEVTVGSPELKSHGSLNGLSGPLKLDYTMAGEDDALIVKNKGTPDLVLLNNDLTDAPMPGLTGQPVTPPKNMGWHRRRKSEHFNALEFYVEEISELLDLDPWLLHPMWFVSEEKCLEEDSCLELLVIEIDAFIETIRRKYVEYEIDEQPVVYIKNDRGTYGLGIITLTEGSQLLNLSKRKLHKLTYGKGGALAENFLIQEGIPTAISIDGSPAEPVIYLIDGRFSSMFYRINPKRDRFGNLNSPSANFLSKEEWKSSEFEWLTERDRNLHELIAELAMLAMGAELKTQN